MKRLSGGAVLLNLTDISLGLTSGEVTITDAGVLGELTELRNFIDTQRDFSKGFKSLKPVLVEYRSSASKFNGIALANLSFNTDALHMSIGVNTIQADGKMLVITINVVYAWSDYIGYTISSAKLNAYETLATGDGTFTGDVGVGGDLAVTGDTSIGGDLSVTGDTSGIKIEDLVDKAGNKRFIEGNFSLYPSIVEEGFTGIYCKWSLSGSHLMIVLAGSIEDETTHASTDVALIEIPEWVFNKIYPVGSSIYIEQKVIKAYSEDFSTSQDMAVSLRKRTNSLDIVISSFTATAKRYFRAEFDLLIDDDYE